MGANEFCCKMSEKDKLLFRGYKEKEIFSMASRSSGELEGSILRRIWEESSNKTFEELEQVYKTYQPTGKVLIVINDLYQRRLERFLNPKFFSKIIEKCNEPHFLALTKKKVEVLTDPSEDPKWKEWKKVKEELDKRKALLLEPTQLKN